MLDISFWGKNHLAGVDRGHCHVIEEEISLSHYLSPPRRLYSGRGTKDVDAAEAYIP